MIKKKATLSLTPILPNDMMEEILLRLPVRCLLRLKCVSKSWFSLISDYQFAKFHFDLALAPQSHRLRLKLSNEFKANLVDTEEPFQDNSAKVIFNIPNPSCTAIPKRESPKFELSANLECEVNVVGSCRGFLLLTTVSSKFIYFVIWNPSTGLQKQFKKVSPKLPFLCGIGYDSSTDDYVVVTLTFPRRRRGREVHCFSSRTNSWSYTCTEGTVPRIYIWGDFAHGSLLNGTLHWLVYSFDNRHSIIITFDVMEKRLSQIPLPPELEASFFFYHLSVMGGCLCLSVSDHEIVLAEIWMMKEYKVWTRSFVFSTYLYPLYRFLPICFTKNGEILGHDCTKSLVRLNDKGELVERGAKSYMLEEYDLLHCGMYSESLLSLPSDFEKLTDWRSTMTTD